MGLILRLSTFLLSLLTGPYFLFLLLALCILSASLVQVCIHLQCILSFTMKFKLSNSTTACLAFQRPAMPFSRYGVSFEEKISSNHLPNSVVSQVIINCIIIDIGIISLSSSSASSPSSSSSCLVLSSLFAPEGGLGLTLGSVFACHLCKRGD